MTTLTTRRRAAALGLVLALAGGLAATGRGQGEKGGLRAFMRQKLEFSESVLEGLALEDYDKIARGARAMEQLAEDSRWRISPNINYLRISSEFQGLAQELAQKARERNLDGATLAYVNLTISCVKCHKLVRDDNLTWLAPPAPPRRS